MVSTKVLALSIALAVVGSALVVFAALFGTTKASSTRNLKAQSNGAYKYAAPISSLSSREIEAAATAATDGAADCTPTFHVLIATAGRPSLRRMLRSLLPQLSAADAVTVVFDGEGAKDRSGFVPAWTAGFEVPVHIVEQIPNLGYWGHGVRNAYQTRLQTRTTFIMHADDDDVYTPHAFEMLRKLCADPHALYVAQMQQEGGEVIPAKQAIEMSFIGTPCGVVPWSIAGKSTWAPLVGGDFAYYHGLSAHADVVFLGVLIYVVRPAKRSRTFSQ